MLDRTISPDFQTITSINIPPVQVITLSNGIPLYVVSVGEQPVIKIEFSFEAGNWQEPQNGVSLFTTKMISEGTSKYSSAEISEYFDKFGSFTESGQGLDRANFVVYGLKKHLPSLLPMVQELLNEATFPEKELETLKNIQLQTLQVNSEKTSFIANKTFRKKVFGNVHPYGNSMTEEAIRGVNQSIIIDFYKKYWQSKPYKIYLSGNIGEDEIKLIEQYFGSQIISQSIENKIFVNSISPKGENVLIEKD